MHSFVFMTDLACDIDPKLLSEWGVEYIPLSFYFDDEPEKEYFSDSYPMKEFYSEVRGGRVAKTSAVSRERFSNAFRKYLDDGKDIFYLAFSSGLSSTYNNSVTAAGEVLRDYPDRRILVSDTRSASSGMGLLVYLVNQKIKNGAGIDEAFEYAEELRFRLCHWFTVDDLKYLRRGGRVSAAAAFFGGVLSIKPVLHMDDPGHLIPMMKVPGRRNSLNKMADKFGELCVDKTGGTVFISHGDCENDALQLASILKERYGTEVDLISMIGPVIGAHSGPGTLALFFEGSER